MNRQPLLALTIGALFATACGGSTSNATVEAPPAGQSIVVSTAPADTDVPPGGSVRFSAQVTGSADSSVSWMVVEADGGTVDASGVYTAPPTEGTYHVQAMSALSTKSTGRSVVRVKKGAVAPVVVAVNPATVTVPAGGTHTFAAAVTGTTVLSVRWTVQEGSSCGSVSASGAYTAPNAGATCHVVATSVATPSGTATATVTVTAPPVTIAINPTTATLDACRGQVFTATVGNTGNTAVTWTITEAGGGTVNNGAYVAPTAAGLYHVVAVSQADPSKTATAIVTVGAERILSVAVVPGSGSVSATGTLPFAANVTTTCGTFSAQ